MLITWILVIGIRESAWFNTAMVVLKLVIIAFFVIFGAFYVKPENWHPFAPNGTLGIFSAAAIIFFAYIGFDAVLDRGRRDEESQARHADRHHREPGGVHHHLYRRRDRADRHAAVDASSAPPNRSPPRSRCAA